MRLWIIRFLLALLLLQSAGTWALAKPMPMPAFESTQEAIPCHATLEQAAAPDCCCAECDCFQTCAVGVYSLPVQAYTPHFLPPPHTAPARFASVRVAGFRWTLLRPPATTAA